MDGYQLSVLTGWVLGLPWCYPSMGHNLINHSSSSNLKAKAVIIQGKVEVGFVALKDIEANDELSFDYGRQPNTPNWLRRR